MAPLQIKAQKPTPRLSVKGKRTVGNSMAQISPTAPRRAPIQKSLPKKRSTSRLVELNPRVHHGHDQVGKDVAQHKEKGGDGQGSHDHRLVSAQKSLILQKPKPWISKTDSMRMLPLTKMVISCPRVEAMGINELRKACLKTAPGTTRLWRPPS